MNVHARCAVVLFCLVVLTCLPAMGAPGPAHLRVDNLTEPLGIDDPAPKFSWQLEDPARGAKQTAYRIDLFAGIAGYPDAKFAFWSSGRVESDQSLNVRYAGPALKPSTRYYWLLTVWGADGKPYPHTEPTTADREPAWFETGLMNQDAWKAQWIGYETTEEAAVRHAPSQWIVSPDAAALGEEKSFPEQFAYRTVIHVDKAVKAAALFATAEDTAAAWINGEQVLDAAPFPAWRQLPWKKFVRADVTGKLKTGDNTLALESVLYTGSGRGPRLRPSLRSTWSMPTEALRHSIRALGGRRQSMRRRAGSSRDLMTRRGRQQLSGSRGAIRAAAGHPWIPDSVKVLRHAFNVTSPIKSARIYSTALGEYELFLNGKRVSEDYFAPGWTDYRERVVYQTYDVTPLLVEGQNAIGALLAPGWYETPLEWFQQPNNYGDTPPALRAQIRIEHADGTVDGSIPTRRGRRGGASSGIRNCTTARLRTRASRNSGGIRRSSTRARGSR